MIDEDNILEQLKPNMSQLNPDLSELNPTLSQLNPNLETPHFTYKPGGFSQVETFVWVLYQYL